MFSLSDKVAIVTGGAGDLALQLRRLTQWPAPLLF